jgi:hypothetical protein
MPDGIELACWVTPDDPEPLIFRFEGTAAAATFAEQIRICAPTERFCLRPTTEPACDPQPGEQIDAVWV